MTSYDARDVLEKYVVALDATGASVIRDAAALSHPKDVVKSVLQHCIRTIEAPDQQEFLRSAYLSLAGFQALTPDERQNATELNKVWSQANGEPGARNGSVLGQAAAPLSDIIGQIRAETIILAQELKSLPGADVGTSA
jgi:hypothetical protein